MTGTLLCVLAGCVAITAIGTASCLRTLADHRERIEAAEDAADRALGLQLANADTDVIPVLPADLPRRRPRPYPDDVDEQLKRFNFEGGSRA